MREWKDGDKVAAPIGMGRNSITTKTVKRILNRFVELNDGSKWSHDGYPYPHVRYNTRSIRPMTPELETAIHRQRGIRFLEKIEWGEVGTDTAERIVAILKAEKTQVEQGSAEE